MRSSEGLGFPGTVFHVLELLSQAMISWFWELGSLLAALRGLREESFPVRLPPYLEVLQDELGGVGQHDPSLGSYKHS